MTEDEGHICPRCKVNMAGLGTSRLDSTTHICGPCNTAEAMDDFLLGHITPQSEWPVATSSGRFPDLKETK